MTDEEWAELEPLAKAVATAKARWIGIQTANVWGIDERTRIEMNAKHERTMLEFQAAQTAYTNAQKRILGFSA